MCRRRTSRTTKSSCSDIIKCVGNDGVGQVLVKIAAGGNDSEGVQVVLKEQIDVIRQLGFRFGLPRLTRMGLAVLSTDNAWAISCGSGGKATAVDEAKVRVVLKGQNRGKHSVTLLCKNPLSLALPRKIAVAIETGVTVSTFVPSKRTPATRRIYGNQWCSSRSRAHLLNKIKLLEASSDSVVIAGIRGEVRGEGFISVEEGGVGAQFVGGVVVIVIRQRVGNCDRRRGVPVPLGEKLSVKVLANL